MSVYEQPVIRSQTLRSLTLLCMLLLCGVAEAADGSEKTAQSASSSHNLGPQINYYIDQEGKLDVDEVLALNQPEWSENPSGTPNFGVDNRAYWFRQNLPAGHSGEERLIEIAYPVLDEVALWFISKGQVVRQIRTGDHHPFAERPIHHRNFLFPVPAGYSELEVLVRVQTSGAMQLPIYLWQQDAFWEQDQLQLISHSFFIAILLTIALYNLMLFLSLRDSVYLLYVLYTASLLLSQMGLRGLNLQLLAPDSPIFAERILLVSVGMAIVFACLFARQFMSLQKHSPRLNLLLLAIAGLALAQAITGTFMAYAQSLKFGIVLTGISCPCLLLVGLHQWLKGVKVARFFTLAWVVYLVGQFAIVLSKFGLIPRTTLVEYGPEIGASIEVILLSFALADRMNEERRQRYAAQHDALLHEKAARKAQDDALEAQNRANEALEERVEERTQELRDALEALSEVNEKLRTLSTKDGLTEVSNRRAFDEIFDREWRRCTRDKTELTLLMIDADHFKSVNDEFGHLAGDECLKFVAQVMCNAVRRPADTVARLGGEEFAVLLPNTSLNGALVIAERIRSEIDKRGVLFERQTIGLKVSIGVSSTIPDSHLQPQVLVERADQALYRAKRAGRNRVMFAEVLNA